MLDRIQREVHMYARIATFEGGDTEKLREMNEERMSSGQMQMPDGMSGGMAMAGDKNRLFITYFDSKEAVDAAEAQFEKMGDDIPEDVRGRRTSVDVYEVVWNTLEQ
jgi:hypothetical protein